MDKNGFCPVGSCKKGQEYYLRTFHERDVVEYKPVIFWEYRPHPAEVAIKDGAEVKLAYRCDLFQLKSDLG